MSKLNLPVSWSTALQDEIVSVLCEDEYLQPIADAIIGRAADDILREMRTSIERHGVGIYVWPVRIASLYTEVRGLALPSTMDLQIDVRESPHYNETGASAYAIADYILSLLHGAQIEVRNDGRCAHVVGDKEPIQSEIEELSGLNMSVETVSIFFTVHPRSGAQPTIS